MTALRFLAGVATALATSTPAPAPAPAEPAEAAPCRLEWRANSGRDHDLNDGCLPALSVDGRRLAVARIESGSFTVLVLSVPGKGRELRSFHAHDVSDAPAVAKTVREVNAVLERDGYRRVPELDLPTSQEFVLERGGLKLGFRAGRLEASCGSALVARSRRLGSIRDEPLGAHAEILTGLFLPDPAAFALMKVEPVSKEGFYLPGGVEWIVVPLTARCP